MSSPPVSELTIQELFQYSDNDLRSILDDLKIQYHDTNTKLELITHLLVFIDSTQNRTDQIDFTQMGLIIQSGDYQTIRRYIDAGWTISELIDSEDILNAIVDYGAIVVISLLETGSQESIIDHQNMIMVALGSFDRIPILTWMRDHDWVIEPETARDLFDSIVEYMIETMDEDYLGVLDLVLSTDSSGHRWLGIDYSQLDFSRIAEFAENTPYFQNALNLLYNRMQDRDRAGFELVYQIYPEYEPREQSSNLI